MIMETYGVFGQYSHKPFARGAAWQRPTSPPDPEFETYTVGIHLRCQGKAAITK